MVFEIRVLSAPSLKSRKTQRFFSLIALVLIAVATDVEAAVIPVSLLRELDAANRFSFVGGTFNYVPYSESSANPGPLNYQRQYQLGSGVYAEPLSQTSVTLTSDTSFPWHITGSGSAVAFASLPDNYAGNVSEAYAFALSLIRYEFQVDELTTLAITARTDWDATVRLTSTTSEIFNFYNTRAVVSLNATLPAGTYLFEALSIVDGAVQKGGYFKGDFEEGSYTFALSIPEPVVVPLLMLPGLWVYRRRWNRRCTSRRSCDSAADVTRREALGKAI